MIPYVDTSVLVALLVQEAMSRAAGRWFGERRAEGWTTSLWTATEFASAIGNRVRGGSLSREQGEAALVAFERELSGAAGLVEPSPADFVFARRALSRFDLRLRAGDALHVAIALRTDALVLVTLDRRLANAARAFGLDAAEPA